MPPTPPRNLRWLLLGWLLTAAGCNTFHAADRPLPLAERPPIEHRPAPPPYKPPVEEPAAEEETSEGEELASRLAWLRENDPAEYEKLRNDLAAIDPALQAGIARQISAQLQYIQEQRGEEPREEQTPPTPVEVVKANPAQPAGPSRVAREVAEPAISATAAVEVETTAAAEPQAVAQAPLGSGVAETAEPLRLPRREAPPPASASVAARR